MTRIQEANRIWCGKTAKPKPIQIAKNQRSSETQYLENDKKDGNSGSAPSPRLLGTNHVA
jgi:hypothetical protein